MNFLNPAVLFGLIAASIPLILHLLNLRKLKRVEFSSLKFIKELQKTKIRRIKLKQIILLILRTLIIAFIVLAFSRPTIESNLPLVGTYAKSSIVILFDNSFSMDASDEFGNRFKQAKNSAEEILKSMKQGDDAVIIPMSGSPERKPALSSNKEMLLSELSKVSVNYPNASLEKTIGEAYKLLEESDNLNHEIYIISDAQKNIFDLSTEDSLELYNPKAGIYFVNIGAESKTEISNYSIDSLKIVTKIIQQDMPVEIEATVRNNTNKRIEGLVVSLFYNDERTAQKAVDIEGGKSVSVTMNSEPKDFGVVKGFLEIETDALDYDNRRYFSYLIPEKPNVAIFGSRQMRYPIETLFGLYSGKVSATSYEANQISSIDLTKFDMLIITDGCNRDIQFDKLKSYVEQGNSVFMFAEYEDADGSYLQKLRKLGIESSSMVDYTDATALELNYSDKKHPLFEGVFRNDGNDNKKIESPKINRIYPVQSGMKLLGTAAGSFLSEHRLGSGKVLFAGISPDLNWSNFVRTGLFPVIMFRSAFYLTAAETFGQSITTGEQTRLILDNSNGSSGSYKLIDPTGVESFKETVVLPSSRILEISDTYQPGVYTIISDKGKITDLLTVNHPPSESSRGIREEDNIKQDLSRFIDERTEIEFIDRDRMIDGFSRARTGTELWQLFIVLAILAALAEMIVARTSKIELISD